jgi:hypothetical protein
LFFWLFFFQKRKQLFLEQNFTFWQRRKGIANHAMGFFYLRKKGPKWPHYEKKENKRELPDLDKGATM